MSLSGHVQLSRQFLLPNQRKIFEILTGQEFWVDLQGDVERATAAHRLKPQDVADCFGNPQFCSLFFAESSKRLMMAVPSVLYRLSIQAKDGDPEAQRLFFKVMSGMKGELEKTWAAQAASGGDLATMADGLAELPAADLQALWRLVDEKLHGKGITAEETRGENVHK